MTYEVQLLHTALLDLDEICAYKSQFSGGTVQRFLDQIEEKFSNLAENPCMYTVYPYNPAYRKISVSDYLIFYQVDENARRVSVYRILHGKREIKNLL